jgi:uncharacterized protein YndB with AHSA1/START domain
MNTVKQQPLTFEYTFDAPKALVFGAFADAEALNAWWGPVDCRNKVVKLDFREGGIFHFSMENQHGKITYGRFLFKTIEPHDLLEFTNAFADEKANVVKAPFDIPLPLEILYKLVFTELNNKTTIHLTAEAVGGSEEEIAGLQSINPSQETGLGATFKQLADYLLTGK